jgi:hypothetical protein
MLLLQETVLTEKGVVRIELHDDFRYRLSCGDLVEYVNGQRRIRGRSRPYEFRSVEQLRYDFEQDVAAEAARQDVAAQTA